MGRLHIRMPALSATMEDAELHTWLVAVGDEVRTGQPIAEVATDKVDMELESPYDGTIAELLTSPGTRVALGEVVATLTSDEEDLLGDLDLGGGSGGATAAEVPSATAGRTSTTASPPGNGQRHTVPAAPPPLRMRAKRLGIDLREVTPSGSRGQITNADLQAFLAAREQAAEPATPPAAGSAPAAVAGAPAAVAGAPSPRQRAVRRATARTTTRSASVPQFTLHRRLDVTVARERRAGRSWTTELARALAAALWRHPEVNGVWDEEAEEVVPLPGVRIGIAVDTPDGLLVVGVDDPDGADPTEADRRIKQAIERGRSGRVTGDDTRDVSITISNLGGLGIDRFDALLLPPQPLILSVGRLREVPMVVDGHVRVRPVLDIGLTVDHRVADGADGARFLATFAARLES